MPDDKDKSEPTPPKNDDAQFTGQMLDVAAKEMGAMAASQVLVAASAAYALYDEYVRYFLNLALDKDDKFRMVEAEIGDFYKESSPLCGYIPTKPVVLQETNLSFDMEITTSKMDNSKMSGSGSIDAEVGGGISAIFKASVKTHAQFSASSDRTHKQDSSSKVHYDMKIGLGETPPGILKLQERIERISRAMTEAQIKKLENAAAA